jgi:hypothetical protein
MQRWSSERPRPDALGPRHAIVLTRLQLQSLGSAQAPKPLGSLSLLAASPACCRCDPRAPPSPSSSSPSSSSSWIGRTATPRSSAPSSVPPLISACTCIAYAGDVILASAAALASSRCDSPFPPIELCERSRSIKHAACSADATSAGRLMRSHPAAKALDGPRQPVTCRARHSLRPARCSRACRCTPATAHSSHASAPRSSVAPALPGPRVVKDGLTSSSSTSMPSCARSSDTARAATFQASPAQPARAHVRILAPASPLCTCERGCARSQSAALFCQQQQQLLFFSFFSFLSFLFFCCFVSSSSNSCGAGAHLEAANGEAQSTRWRLVVIILSTHVVQTWRAA